MIKYFNTALSSQAGVQVNASAERIENQTVRLSSGSRLNKTVDDAGATAQSMQFTAASGRAVIVKDQVQSAVSFLEVQSSSLTQIYNILSRISDLRARATDATMVPIDQSSGSGSTASKTTGDRFGYQAEYEALRQQLVDEMRAESNGINVFAPTRGALSVRLTEDGNQAMTISQLSLYDGTPFVSIGSGGGAASSATAALGAFHDEPVLLDLNIADIDQSIQMISGHLANNLGEQSRLKFAMNRLGDSSFEFDVAKSRFADADLAKETTRLTQSKAVHDAAISALKQATASTQFILKIIEARQGS